MARDLWITKREAVKIDRIKKSITLPADSFSVFRKHACLEYNVSDNNSNDFPIAEDLTDAFTFELWFKPLLNSSSKQVILRFGETTPGFEFSITNGLIRATVWKAAAPTNVTHTSYLGIDSWYHIAATYDNVTLKLYLNGELIGSSAIAGALDAGSILAYIAQSAPLTDLFIGRIAEIRIWTVTRTATQIWSAYQNPRNAGMGDVTGLFCYFKCNGVSVNGSGEEQNQILTSQSINASNTKFTTEDTPPLIFGASFVAAEYEVTLDYKCSIKFPIVPSEGTTGMLVVKWVDDAGAVKRYRFWDLDGVDINPFPPTYNGEVLSETFVLEWWNSDGAEMIEVPEAIILHISKTTNPTTSFDRTAVSAETVVVNENLAEPYPLQFPLAFNEAQSYT